MTVLSLIWHWIADWIWGWGGIGGAISIGAWLLWYFTPGFLASSKSTILHIAIGATIFTVGSTYIFTEGYNAGEAECTARWDKANIKAAADKKALQDAVAFIAASEVRKATEDLQQQADALQQKVKDYEKTLENRVGGNCPLGSDDLSKLRSIR